MTNLKLTSNKENLPFDFYSKKFEKEIKDFQIMHISKAKKGFDKNSYSPNAVSKC